MKKNIKEDQKREVFLSEYLNNNALLELTSVENKDIVFSIRYVDVKERSIKEHYLTKLSIDDYVSEKDNLIKISEDSSTIAVFKKLDEKFQLSKVYDTKKNEFILEEFIDIVYEKKFPNYPLDKQFILKNNLYKN